MANADIQVRLRDGVPDGPYLRYEPGSEIAGTVEVRAESEVTCNHLFIRLRWHTEGRGDRNEDKIAEMDVYQGTLWADMPHAYDFRFSLPRQPWSYAGRYVNIVWEIAVEVDVPWSRNPRFSQPFLLAPRRT